MSSMSSATRAASATVLALSLVLTGCAGDDESTLRSAQLPELVLQPSDLPPVFERFDEGPQGAADAPAGARADPARFGRQGGWKARYSREATTDTTGPLVVESRVDLFESEDGAEDDLEAYRQEFAEAAADPSRGQAEVLPPPELGEGAAAWTLREIGVMDVRYFTVAWRTRNVTASVRLSGLEGKLTLEDALEIARRQQDRIAVAAPS
jgi:hypothetical protein